MSIPQGGGATRTFVLVHGAWHGGWCWRRVSERLVAAGHRVFSPTLTGLADRAHLLTPEVNLMTHVQDVVGLIQSEELEDIVLCGHSYGGMVITGVAEALRSRMDALVYLDAFVPEPNQSLVDVMPEDRREKARLAFGSSWRIPSPSAASWKITSPEDQAWVDRRTSDQPAACMLQALEHDRPWEHVRKAVYIRAAAYDPSPFAAVEDRLKNTPGWQIERVACGHEVMVQEPEWLTQRLLAAGQR